MGMLSALLRLAVSIIVACACFYFCPTQYLYYALIIIVGLYAVLGNETHFLIALGAFLLLGVLAVFTALAQSVGFFVQVWDLIHPGGPNLSWSMQLPQLFLIVLPVCIAIMIGALSFVSVFYQGWADQYLAFAFAKVMILVFFAFTLLNCLFVSFALYTVLSSTFWALFVWECIFTWLPFLTLSFIIYLFLGQFTNREARLTQEYRDRVDRLDRRAKREDRQRQERRKISSKRNGRQRR